MMAEASFHPSLWERFTAWVRRAVTADFAPLPIILSLIVLAIILWTALRDRVRFGFDPLLGALALVGLAAYLALPRLLLGGAYVDMRMLGIAVALALVAIRVKPVAAVCAPRIAAAAASFFALRLVTSTIAMILFAQAQQGALVAVAHLPRGAAVLVLVDEPCSTQWHSDRLGHLDGPLLVGIDARPALLAGVERRQPRRLHEAEPGQGSDAGHVYAAPDAALLARREADRVALGVDALADAVDPTVAQRLVDGFGPGDARPARSRIAGGCAASRTPRPTAPPPAARARPPARPACDIRPRWRGHSLSPPG